MASKEKPTHEKEQSQQHVKTSSAKSGAKTKSHVVDKEKEKMHEALTMSEEKNKELQDKYLRLSAEFDNYRKRTLKEKTDLIKTAAEDLLIKIIPILDDLERGLQAMNTAKDPDAVKEGMVHIYNRFKEFLERNGIKEIEAMNQDFDMDLHEAVTKIPAGEDEQKGKVVEVIEKGYLLHDKVIRYPKVVVGE